MKRFVVIIAMFFAITAYATTNETENVHPWVALSSLWGQGNAGLAYSQKPITYFMRYDFVWKWSENEFTYHEVGLSSEYKDTTIGSRYRWQLDQDEVAPYIGHFDQWRLQYPITLYNEAEYRFNPAISGEDYARTRTLLMLYASNAFYKEHSVRPYVALDVFANWRDVEVEKTRFLMGYIMRIGRFSGTVYVIPWRDGIKEEEWKDVSFIGASAIVNF